MDRDAKKLATRCPCLRDRSNEPYILKVMDIWDNGVTIFRVVAANKDLTENDDLIDMNGDAIVIYNSSDIFITPKKLRAAINPNSIQCPRCREYLIKAETVLKNITFLDRNGLMAICDHCIARNKIFKSCVKCAVANKRFSKAFRNLETKFLPSQNRKFRLSSAPTRPDLKNIHDQRQKVLEQRKYSIPVKSFDSDFSVTDLGRIKSRRNNKLWKYMVYSDEKAFREKKYSKDLNKYYSSSILPRKDKHQIHSSEFTPLSFKVSHERDKEKPILQSDKIEKDTGETFRDMEYDKKYIKSNKLMSIDSEIKKTKGTGNENMNETTEMDFDEDEPELYKQLMNAKAKKRGTEAGLEHKKEKLKFDKIESGKEVTFKDLEGDKTNINVKKMMSKDSEEKNVRGTGKENMDTTTKMNLDDDEQKLHKKLMNAKVENKETIDDLKSNKAGLQKGKEKNEKEKFDKKDFCTEKHIEDDELNKKNINAKKMISKDLEGKVEKGTGKGKIDKTTQMDLDEDEQKLFKKLMNAKEVTKKKELIVDLKSNKTGFEQGKQNLEKQKFDKKEFGTEKPAEEIETDKKILTAKKIMSKDLEEKKGKGIDTGDIDKTTQKDLDEDELKLYKKLMNAKEVTEKKEIKVDLKSNKAVFEQTKQILEKQKFDKKEFGIEKTAEETGTDKKKINAKKIMSKDLEEKNGKGIDAGNIDKTTQNDLDEDELKLYKKLMNARKVTDKKEIIVDLKLSGNKEAFEKKMQTMDKNTDIDRLLNSRKYVKKVTEEHSACDSFDEESSIHMNNSESNTVIIEHDICKIQKHTIREAVPQDALYFRTMIRDQGDFDSLPEKEETVTKTQTNDPINIGKGVIRYALSDRKFIDKGWTMLPVEKVVRKMNIYRMRPARPTFDWFEHNKHKGFVTYDTGEKLAEINNNGRGQWFYKNGSVALDYYDCEELHAQQRVVLYSSKKPDEHGRRQAVTILATFDYLGNGVVFDHAGKIRLKYNQTEGVVLDRTLGPVSNWKWHSLNDPPVLQQVMMDTQLPYKNPDILKLNPTGRKPNKTKENNKNEDMLAIEFDNFIKEKAKKLKQHFKPYQIKMKALKINEHFSLRILDQATIYLLYRDGKTKLKLNLGMQLDHKEIIDTDTAEVGQVTVSAELLPAKTDSLAVIHDMIDKAKRFDKSYQKRELRIHPAVTQLSIDKINACKSSRRPVRDWPNNTSIHAYSTPHDRRKTTCGKLYQLNNMF